MELDNIKMWESLMKYSTLPGNYHLQRQIEQSLRDQGLQYNSDTKKIEYIKQELSKLEVGKLYKCTKDCYTAVGAKILSEGKLYHCTAENEVFSKFGYSIWVGDLLCYFRPATEEEIPHEEYYWNGIIEKKEATGVLKEMLDNIDEKPADNEMIEILRAEYEKGRADAIVEMQNPAWSKEDEEILKELIKFIPYHLTAHSYNQYYNWVISHRPQPHWKPSDEQMEYLAKAITTLGNEGDNKTSAILYELRTDLKKLKC